MILSNKNRFHSLHAVYYTCTRSYFWMGHSTVTVLMSSTLFVVAGGVSEQTKNRFTSRTPQVPGNKASMPQAKSSKQEIWEEWSRYVSEKIHSLLADRDYDKGRQWRVRVTELVHVKSYAPHVDHLVADVECRPDKI